MNRVLVGVDSGGTRTNVEVCVHRSGASQKRNYEVGESLSGPLPPDRIVPCLRKIFAPLQMNIDALDGGGLPIYIWVSAAGFTSWTRNDYLAALHDVTADIAHDPVVAAGAANDGVSVLLGHRADGVIIAGTGSSTIVRPHGGHIYQVGGHEWVASDCGSGFWIGIRSIRQAYRDSEAGNSSVLLQRFRELYGIRSGSDHDMVARLRQLAIADWAMKREIARFASSVCDAAERGDLDAQNIVKAEAEELADLTAGAIRRKFGAEQLHAGIHLVQCGSVLANEFYRASFEAQVEMRMRSGADRRAVLRWERVKTGVGASIALARNLEDGTNQYQHLDSAFRPVIVRR
ncbi:BadF/BadG/BcrA/BcrD ATPase family protein [Nocardia asteroides]|uniref:BadF/BadG/BcrA/BcrD ATPase family protein n=1 Tax=Nocardia asteroides TaxID=1824 RepID=UPI0037C87E39